MLYNKSRYPDKVLLILTILCSVGGILLVCSLVDVSSYQTVSAGVSKNIIITKLAAFVIGAAACVILSLTDLEKITRHWKLIGAGGILFTLTTFTPLGIAPSGSDDRAWLDLRFFTVQPSEVLKLCFIITFSVHIAHVKEHFNKPLTVLGLLCHAAVPILIVHFQGDQGTGVIFFIIAVVMMFAGGLSWKYVTAALMLSPLVIWAAWKWLLMEHQKSRIMVLFNPELDPLGTGFQQIQGKKALQSGGFFGKGLFSGDTEQFIYVSESQNDFIFSYAGQTVGFIGCGIIILLLFAVCLRLISDCGKCKPVGSSVCAGVFGFIFAHTFINIGMVLGILPVIGVPLPFFSAGGTAMTVMLTAVGLVQSALKNGRDAVDVQPMENKAKEKN